MENLNKEIPLEIERKYLIKMPDIERLSEIYSLKLANIVQTYLKSTDSMRRVRKKTTYKTVYYFTEKRAISNLVRYEDEREITQAEYENFLLEADENCRTIIKDRFSFDYLGKTVELDIFPFWENVALAEIEMENEFEEVKLPPEIELIREVTEEKAFSNKNLALSLDVKLF